MPLCEFPVVRVRASLPLGSPAMLLGFALLAAAAELTTTGCTSQEGAASPVAIRVVGADGVDAAVAGCKGKVLLMDFWASWCGPCKAEFPHTVEMARKYGGKGLETMSVSLDDPKDEAKALAFLHGQGATFQNLLIRTGASQESIVALNLKGGSIPQYKIYDRAGKLRQQFFHDPLADKPFTPDDIEKSIQELLAEK
jgi:thiol-disulfide isomerase/thioredoxin